MFKDGTFSFDHIEFNRFVLAFQQTAITKLRTNVTQAQVSHVGQGSHTTICDLMVRSQERSFFQKAAEMDFWVLWTSDSCLWIQEQLVPSHAYLNPNSSYVQRRMGWRAAEGLGPKGTGHFQFELNIYFTDLVIQERLTPINK